VSDEKLWDESPTSRHLQVLYHQTSFQIELKFELELLYSNQRNFILNSVHAPTWIRSLKGQLTWIFFVWFFCSHRQNFSFWFYITKFLSTLVTWLSCGKQTKFDNPHCWVRALWRHVRTSTMRHARYFTLKPVLSFLGILPLDWKFWSFLRIF